MLPTHSITHTASRKIADIIECEVINAIRDKYDGYLYYLTRIGWEDGAVKIDVIVTRYFPEDIVNDNEIIERIDMSEVMTNMRGIS